MEDVIFWKVGGYKQVLEDIRQGQRSCELFMKMVQERAEIEERYARSLESWKERWLENVSKGREVGGTVQAWCVCLEEAAAVAQIHRACMERLTGNKGPIVNMMGWIDKHYKRSDSNGFHLVQRLEEDFQEASTEFSDEYTRALRAKEAYHTLSKEAQKARQFAEEEQLEAKVNDTTKSRLFSRADKLTIRENYVRRIYKRRIAVCQGEVKDRYKEQMEQVLEKCRSLESVRLQCLQNQILTFISLLDMTSSSESLLSSCRSRYKKVAANDPSRDVQEWLSYFHLSRFIELPTFEEYYLEEDDYQPSKENKISTDKKKRPSGSFFQLSLFGSSSEDESSDTSKSSSSSSSSESEGTSTSSESEGEITSLTSVSSQPYSPYKHPGDTIPQSRRREEQPQSPSASPHTEDERRESTHVNGTIPHSTLSTGFPVNNDIQGSSSSFNQDVQLLLQKGGNAEVGKGGGGCVPQSEHHVYDVPNIQSPLGISTDSASEKFLSEGNIDNVVDLDESKTGRTQSSRLPTSVTNVQNATEIHNTKGEENVIISESKPQSSISKNFSYSATSSGSQYDNNELAGHPSTFGNAERRYRTADDDVIDSQEPHYNPVGHDRAIEVQSFVGPYFINKNFRWASVSPPVASKGTAHHSSERCNVDVKKNEVYGSSSSDESHNGNDSVEQKTPYYDNGLNRVNSGHAERQRQVEASEDVWKETPCNSQPQMSNECFVTHRHHEVNDRPIKACLAQWFLSKYPEYTQLGERMWEQLQATNPCRYREAMMDAKRLMVAVGARSMICLSSDKPRALHLCNSLHRCRECFDDKGPCQCYNQGERPLFTQHTTCKTSREVDNVEDYPHVKEDQKTRHRQDLQDDHTCQEAADRILHLHGQLNKHNKLLGEDCGNLRDHVKESDHMCSMAAELILNHVCDKAAEMDRCRSFNCEKCVIPAKHLQSDVWKEGHLHSKGSSEFASKHAEGERFLKDATTSQESDFSSDDSNSPIQCLSCDYIDSTRDNISEENVSQILKERDRIERQAREILRLSEGEFLVRVLYNFRPANWDELRLRAGEYIVQIGKDSDNGWASGRNRTKRGIFPASYVQFVKN